MNIFAIESDAHGNVDWVESANSPEAPIDAVGPGIVSELRTTRGTYSRYA